MLLALVGIILILGIVGYTFVSIVSTERKASVGVYNSMKAFYINEGALEIAKKYIHDQNAIAPDWAPNTDLFVDEVMGDGTFDLSMYWPANPSEFINFTAVAEVD